MTIKEKLGKLKGVKVCFIGDSNNNVTHSLMMGCSLVGMDISIGCPQGGEHEPLNSVVPE